MTNTLKTRWTVWLVAFFVALPSVSLTPSISSAQSPRPSFDGSTFRGRTMGTTYMVKVFGEISNADDLRIDVDAELRQVNDQMSTYLQSSEISRFNSSQSTDWFSVSADTARVVEVAQEVAEKTDGAFDITVGPIVNAWGFGPEKRTGHPPDASKLKTLQKSVGYEKLSARLDPPAIRKSVASLQIDLSAIAKGHAVDRLVELLAKAGADDVFVEVGGEVRTSGDKKGEPWKVGIQLPENTMTVPMIAHAMGRGDGQDESMATSGDYRNYFEKDGKRYSHTIDPRTNAPIQHKLASVSVVHPSCMVADAWATAINVLGPDDGLEKAKQENLDVLLVTRTSKGYDMKATGTLAGYAEQFAAETSSLAAPVAQADDTSLLPTVLAAAVIMGLVLAAMAVGVMFGGKSISGSCGGLNNHRDEDGNVACSLCSNPADACKDLRERMQKETT